MARGGESPTRHFSFWANVAILVAMTTLAATNQMVRIADLTPHPKNYNRHPTEQIRRIGLSLSEFGQARSIVVWRNFIVAGHGVVEAATNIGWETLRADVLPDEYPEERVLAYVVADNELGRLADPDYVQLVAILEETAGYDADLLLAMGYDESEYADLLAAFQIPDANDWDAGFEGVPDGDRTPFQQMSFLLHDTQVEIVNAGIDLAVAEADFTGSPNDNSLGNALAYMVSEFVERRRQ